LVSSDKSNAATSPLAVGMKNNILTDCLVNLSSVQIPDRSALKGLELRLKTIVWSSTLGKSSQAQKKAHFYHQGQLTLKLTQREKDLRPNQKVSPYICVHVTDRGG